MKERTYFNFALLSIVLVFLFCSQVFPQAISVVLSNGREKFENLFNQVVIWNGSGLSGNISINHLITKRNVL